MKFYFETAWRSFLALASAFGSAVLPGFMRYHVAKPTARHPSDRACFVQDGSSAFFLDFNPTDLTNSDCAGTDWFILIFLFLAIHTISWSLRWTVWEPFYRWHRGNGMAGTSKKSMENFSQSLTACLFFSLSAYFSFRILSNEDWLYDQSEWFQNSHSLGADFKFYYLMFAARYMSDLISLYFEHKRSDTLAFAIHHVTTIALVLVSAHTGYTKAGGLLMFFFDWADPFVTAAKACKYLSSREDDLYQFVTNRLFEIFAVVFVLTRNVLFTYIVYCACSEDFLISTGSTTFSPRLVLRLLLVLLSLVMTYWLVVIVKAAIYQFRHGGNVDDIREDDIIKTEKLQKKKAT